MSVKRVFRPNNLKRGTSRIHQYVGKSNQLKGFVFEQEKFSSGVGGEHGNFPLVGFAFSESRDFLNVDNVVRLHAGGYLMMMERSLCNVFCVMIFWFKKLTR